MHTSPTLFGDDAPQRRRVLPVLGDAIGEQSDIVYREARPKSVLNAPAATGIGCWSLNPYVGLSLIHI